MLVMRFQAWVAAACVAAYTLLAPVELVLCIGAHGGVMLEAACQCCDTCLPAAESGGRLHQREPRMAPAKGACNVCLDVPLRVQGTVQSLASGRTQTRGNAAAALTPAATLMAAPPCASPLRPPAPSSSPPPDVSLLALQSVVLLI